jgi:hypothetical protein
MRSVYRVAQIAEEVETIYHDATEGHCEFEATMEVESELQKALLNTRL